MLKSLLEIMKQLLGLAKDTQDNKDAIKALQARVDRTTETLQQVIFELQRLNENEATSGRKWACVWRMSSYAPNVLYHQARLMNSRIRRKCKGRSSSCKQK